MKKVPVNNIIQKIHTEKGFSVEEIEKKIASKVSELSGLVSDEGAAHIIANELGVQIFQENSPKEPEKQEIKIKDIMPNMRNLIVTAKVTNIFDLVSFERDSNPGKVRSLIIGDETSKTKVAFWHHAAEAIEEKKVEVDTIIKLSNVSSKSNNGRTELSVQNPDDIEVNPTGVTIDLPIYQAKEEVQTKKIVELKEGPASIIATIVQVFKPNFYERCPECGKKVTDSKCILHGEVKSQPACILNIVIDDGTDSMRSVFFNNMAESLVNLSVAEIKEGGDEVLEKIKSDLLGSIVKISGNIRYSSFLTANEIVANTIQRLENINIEKEIKDLE